MSRWLFYGATVTVVVCMVMGVAGPVQKRVAAVSARVGPGSVSAGRAFSVMAAPDGRVSAWGAGRRGQIGDGALRDRWRPASVAGVQDVIAVSSGAAHTLAVTANGELYAWGANLFGRLGDGSQTRRPRPVHVRHVPRVRGISAGRAHSLAVSDDGRVFAWGLNATGQLGIGNRTTKLSPIEVRGLSDIIAVSAGDEHSMALSSSGRVWVWGNNGAGRLGDGTTVDRLRPVRLELRDVTSIAAGATHSLALTRANDVYAWGRGTSGELGNGVARTVSRPARVEGLKASAVSAGRHFSAAIATDGRVLAWGANASGQLGDNTRTRRSRPIVVHGVSAVVALALGDAHAVAVTSSGDVRTWGEGGQGRLGGGTEFDAVAPTEIISDLPGWGDPPPPPPPPPDPVPPSIVVSVSAEATDGWYRTEVTVTFTCADNVAVATCPNPIVVTQDGVHTIAGTAIDTAGNSAVAQTVISIDRTGPTIELAAPEETASPSVVVGTVVSDVVSPLAEVTCNGVSVPDGACLVDLRPGRNLVVVTARDAAGNVSNRSVVIRSATAPLGAPRSVHVTPPMAAMIAGESRVFALSDEDGRDLAGVSWMSSDDEVVAIVEGRISAVGVGSATVTGTTAGMSGTAEVSVHAGPYLPEGVARWRLSPLQPGVASEAAAILLADGVGDVQLFSVEYDEDTRTGATLRALGVDGRQKWLASLPVRPSEAVMEIVSSPGGGVLAAVVSVHDSGRNSIVRAGWTSDFKSWRYDPPAGVLIQQLLQAPDGFVYVLQGSQHWNENWREVGHRLVDKSEIVGIDANNGAVVFRLPQPNYVTYTSSAVGGGLVDESRTGAAGSLTLTPEGDIYYLMREGASSFVGQSHFSTTWSLVRLQRSGAQFKESLSFTSGLMSAAPFVGPVGPPLADSNGGVLVQWASRPHFSAPTSYSGRYRSADGEREYAMAGPLDVQAMSFNGAMIGRQYTATNATVSMDIQTGVTHWSSPDVDGDAAVALDDHGAVMADANGNYRRVKGDGEVAATLAHGVGKGPYAYGRFHGRDANGNLAAVPSRPLDDATSQTRINQPRVISSLEPAKSGVFAKAHRIVHDKSPFKHMALVMVPRNQSRWLTDPVWKDLFVLSESLFGDQRVVTTGGWPNNFNPLTWKLTQDFNQPSDLSEVPDPGAWLSIHPLVEDAVFTELLDRSQNFPDGLFGYSPVPSDITIGFNSNSFAMGLLTASSLRPPAFFSLPAFPGSQKPVSPLFYPRSNEQ